MTRTGSNPTESTSSQHPRRITPELAIALRSGCSRRALVQEADEPRLTLVEVAIQRRHAHPAGLENADDVSVEVAPAGQALLQAVQPVLPPSDPRIVRAAVFDEVQRRARTQD